MKKNKNTILCDLMDEILHKQNNGLWDLHTKSSLNKT